MQNLTEQEKLINEEKYISILSELGDTVPGIDQLIEYLKNTDFFSAPASTVYHSNFEGGLCLHCLNVYTNILKLNDLYELDIDRRSLILVSLLHDISKADFYSNYVQNVKVYKPNGSKFDNLGKYEWEAVNKYKVKDVQERENLYGDHGLNSFMIVNKFIKLTDEEATAIINHHMGLDTGRPRTDISEIFNRCPISLLLCMADMTSAYLDENIYLIK